MKIWITVAVWNRQEIAELTLEQLKEYKGEHHLHVTDDWSDKFNPAKKFSHLYDSIDKTPKKMGIQHLRCWEMIHFLNKRTEDLIYLTDCDAIHDPHYIHRLKELYQKEKKPVSLYNARFHNTKRSIIEDKGNYQLRRTAPGVSHLYDRNMIKKIVANLNRRGFPSYAWDYRIPEMLGLPFATTTWSYIEHFGGPGSIHNNTLTKDTAINPTPYLKNLTPQIIDYLQGTGPKPQLHTGIEYEKVLAI